MGATAFTFLLFFAVGGTFFTLLFVSSSGALGAYVYALRQIHVRSVERMAKVRPLVPRRAETVGSPVLLRQTASN